MVRWCLITLAGSAAAIAALDNPGATFLAALDARDAAKALVAMLALTGLYQVLFGVRD